MPNPEFTVKQLKNKRLLQQLQRMIDMIYTVIFSNKHAHAIAEFNVVEMSKLASYPFDSIYFKSWTFAGIRESFEIADV